MRWDAADVKGSTASPVVSIDAIHGIGDLVSGMAGKILAQGITKDLASRPLGAKMTSGMDTAVFIPLVQPNQPNPQTRNFV